MQVVTTEARLWQTISYRFGAIAAYCSNFEHFAFLSHTLRGLGTTYDVHLGLIVTRARSGLPISVTELFSLGVTAESLRAKTGRKSAISLQTGQFDPKFQVRGVAPTNDFCTDS